MNVRIIEDPKILADLCMVASNFVRPEPLTWLDWQDLLDAAPEGSIGTNPARSQAQLEAWQRRKARRFGVMG